MEPPGTRPPKRAPARELSIRQRKYLRFRKQGQTKYQSALAAGYPVSMALNAKDKIDDLPPVRRVLNAWLEQEQLSDRALGLS